MTNSADIVIVGAGLAGAKAAETLRAEGFEGSIVLIGDEPDAPYERPPLSKSFLRGETPFDEALVHGADWYAEHDVELLTGTRVTALDRHARRVTLADGRGIGFGKLLLATGAQPRTLPLPGADLQGVFVLRDRRDSEALAARIREGGPVAVIGAGWIGSEVAASARQMGAEVTLLEAGSAPLERVLGAEIGGRFADLHRAHGVDVRTGVNIERLDGSPEVEAVVLADGTRIAARTVVIGVGVTPDVALAADAGLANGNGIEVDELLQTRAPDIYAAGDVALVAHARYGRPVRVEHWHNAVEQGAAAARSMIGRGTPWAELPYFFSDQYESGMEYVGLHEPRDTVTVRPGEGTSFTAVWTDADGVVTAGMHFDDWDATDSLKATIGRPADAVA